MQIKFRTILPINASRHSKTMDSYITALTKHLPYSDCSVHFLERVFTSETWLIRGKREFTQLGSHTVRCPQLLPIGTRTIRHFNKGYVCM